MNRSKTFAKYFASAFVVLVLLIAPTNADSLLVSSNGTNQILQYDLDTGAFEKVFADATVLGYDAVGGNLLSQPTGMDIGPDGNVYVAYRDSIGDPTTGGVLRFQPDGTFIDVYSVAVPNIQDIDFGSDGNLYAVRYQYGVSCILGPDSATPGVLDPDHTSIGSVFGVEPYYDPVSDSQCYFRSISHLEGQVRLSNKAGTTLAILDGPWTANTQVPYGLEFGPDGLLYCVSNNGSPSTDVGIYVFDVSTIDYSGGTGAGSFTQIGFSADADPDLNMPLGIAFDNDGDILINNYDDCVAQFSTVDGSYIGNKVGLFEGGLTNPHFGLTVLSDGSPDPIPGDANNDQKVDGSDVTILAGNWQVGVDGTVEATWEMGNFNGDKKVDGSDVTILAGNWQYGVTAAAASVPEPSTIILLVGGVLGLLVWRRNK